MVCMNTSWVKVSQRNSANNGEGNVVFEMTVGQTRTLETSQKESRVIVFAKGLGATITQYPSEEDSTAYYLEFERRKSVGETVWAACDGVGASRIDDLEPPRAYTKISVPSGQVTSFLDGVEKIIDDSSESFKAPRDASGFTRKVTL